MTAFSVFLMFLGFILVFMVFVEYEDANSYEDQIFYGKVIVTGLILFFTGGALLPGKTEAEKLYDENQIMKEDLQEKESKMKRWKYIQHLREENKKLKDSLKNGN